MDTKVFLRQFILENFLFTDDAAAVGDDDSLVARGIIDSLGVLEIIEFLETKFAVKVAEDEMVPDNLDSINKLAAYLATKTA
jgi:acyl carrier protein